MPERKICSSCGVKLCAIANHRNGQTYYRNRCDQCYKQRKKPMPEGWVRAGYKKKEKCEKCGHRFLHPNGSRIHYVNGDITDNHFFNLKTICLQCECYINNGVTKLKPDDLTPDF
jgi:hypothetical protein